MQSVTFGNFFAVLDEEKVTLYFNEPFPTSYGTEIVQNRLHLWQRRNPCEALQVFLALIPEEEREKNRQWHNEAYHSVDQPTGTPRGRKQILQEMQTKILEFDNLTLKGVFSLVTSKDFTTLYEANSPCSPTMGEWAEMLYAEVNKRKIRLFNPDEDIDPDSPMVNPAYDLLPGGE